MKIDAQIKDIASGLSYRDFIIVGLLFRKQGDISINSLENLTDNWIYLQDKQLVAGRLQIFNNWSPQMVADTNNIWLGVEYFCSASDAIWKMTDNELTEFALKEIRKSGLVQNELLLDSTVIKVPKAYPSYIGTYDRFPLLQQFLDQIENLFLIGRNGMHRYNNTDHSMMTAITAVDNIINDQKSRNNIWSVNMEKDFHEEA